MFYSLLHSEQSSDRIYGFLNQILQQCGIRLDGSAPYDIKVRHPDFPLRIIREGSLGLGESYMDGWWECEQIDEMISRAFQFEIEKKIEPKWLLLFLLLRSKIFNLQNKSRAFQVAKHHYDIGNDLYKAMLDPTMAYSCAYWKDSDTLEDAQLAKLDLACRKLKLQQNDKVLDIGCGWGSFAKYAAEHYRSNVTGITISDEQQRYCQDICSELPVDIQVADYRDIHGQYDKIVSIGMFEHVGQKNYSAYMETVNRVMKDEGIFLLHTIGVDQTTHVTDPWIEKYIFPNGKLPSLKQIAEAAEPWFVIEDVHNFGHDYDRTLMAWYDNFIRHWPKLSKKYSQRFKRMWTYYLQCCAGAFRSGRLQLFQIVMRKPSRTSYDSVR